MQKKGLIRMKVLVTGGAGFIGSHLVDQLVAQEHQVLVVDNCSAMGKRNNPIMDHVTERRIDFQILDVNAPQLTYVVKRFQPEAICHLAAQVSVAESISHPHKDFKVNVLGTQNLLQAAVAAGTRCVVLASSAAVYGNPDRVPTREDALCLPLSPYGQSKYFCERLLDYYTRVHGITTVALRVGNVYGPRQYRGGECGVIGIFVDQLVHSQPLTLYGDGTQTRDFVYVRDVAEAYCRAMRNARGAEVCNIGSGQAVSIAALSDQLRAMVGGHESFVVRPERSGDIKHSCLSVVRADHVLGWTATTPLERGLTNTVRWASSLVPA